MCFLAKKVSHFGKKLQFQILKPKPPWPGPPNLPGPPSPPSYKKKTRDLNFEKTTCNASCKSHPFCFCTKAVNFFCVFYIELQKVKVPRQKNPSTIFFPILYYKILCAILVGKSFLIPYCPPAPLAPHYKNILHLPTPLIILFQCNIM